MTHGKKTPEMRTEVTGNLGFWSVEQQQLLDAATVAVAGLGGAGGSVVDKLARMGVAKFALADPDLSDRRNIGRQESARLDTIDMTKVDALSELVLRTNAFAVIERYYEGVTENNMVDFLSGADVALDAIDYEKAYLSVLMGRMSREMGIIMGTSIEIGDMINYTFFRALPTDENQTVEAFFGIGVDDEVTSSTQFSLLDQITEFPPYMPADLLEAIAQDEVYTPAHASGVAGNASVISRAIREIIMYPSKEHVFYYPNVIVHDPDPDIGIHIVHHDDRARVRSDSLSNLGTGTETHRSLSRKSDYKEV